MPEPRYLELIKKEFNDLNIEVVQLRLELKAFKEALEDMVNIIHGTGSNKSLITELALLRHEIDEIKEKISQFSREKLAIWLAVITGFIGFITAITVAIIQLRVSEHIH